MNIREMTLELKRERKALLRSAESYDLLDQGLYAKAMLQGFEIAWRIVWKHLKMPPRLRYSGKPYYTPKRSK